jgi:protein-S-isoprenylcysteine O-methyltransferase Ste14
MSRLVTAYGLLASGAAAGAILYAVGFLGGFPVPKGVDDGTTGPLGIALTIDLALLALFGLQHSVMARPAVKQRSSWLIPPSIERSTYVLLAGLALALLFWLWRPLPSTVWELDGLARLAVHGLFALGWMVLLVAAVAIGPLDLLGLERVLAHAHGRVAPSAVFRTPGPYVLVRHPLMTGFLLVFWAAPTMTAGRLLLAVSMTGYILVAIRLEERDLRDTFGSRYRRYQEEVPALLPLPRRRFRAPADRAAKDDTLGA